MTYIVRINLTIPLKYRLSSHFAKHSTYLQLNTKLNNFLHSLYPPHTVTYRLPNFKDDNPKSAVAVSTY